MRGRDDRVKIHMCKKRILHLSCTLEPLGSVEKSQPQAPYPTNETRISEVEPRHQYFLTLPRWLQCVAKFENHYPIQRFTA